MIKVGNRKVLFSETLVVPEGETAEIETVVNGNEILKLRLTFPQGLEHEGTTNPVIKYELVGDCFELRFANFIDPLGSFSNSPYTFAASSKGEPISYMATVYKRPTHAKIELQLMLDMLS